MRRAFIRKYADKKPDIDTRTLRKAHFYNLPHLRAKVNTPSCVLCGPSLFGRPDPSIYLKAFHNRGTL